jgi:hypothetical protein
VQPAPQKLEAAEGVGMAAVEPESHSKAGPSAAPATPHRPRRRHGQQHHQRAGSGGALHFCPWHICVTL